MPIHNAKGPKKMPTSELRARAEVAQRALADVQAMMAAADPLGAPEDFKEREKRAFAMIDEVSRMLPLAEPVSDAEREALERQLEDMPDDETLREMLLTFKQIVEDPSTPDEIRAEIQKIDIDDALEGLDHVALIAPVARGAQALADALSTPQAPKDASAVALRIETERQAAKRRS